MVYAILKLSYNEIGDTSLVGGICGSAFFISKQIALTAHHLLNKLNYSPNLATIDASIGYYQKAMMLFR